LAYVDAAFVEVGVTEKFASKASRSSRKLESKVAVPVDGHFVLLVYDSKPNLLLSRTPNQRLKSWRLSDQVFAVPTGTNSRDSSGCLTL